MPVCGLRYEPRKRLPISLGSWLAFPTLHSSNSAHPDSGERPTEEQIRADLKAIAPYTRAIRTYLVYRRRRTGLPIAAEFGLKVTVGAWIDKNQGAQSAEIRSGSTSPVATVT